MTKLLEGKIAVVTGASRGIGYATAKVLAEQGAHIIAIARTVGGLEELDDEIQKMGSSATLVPLDVSDFEGLDRMGKAIYERWGKLDILVGNAAALGITTPIGHISPKKWDTTLAVNVTANWRLIRSLDPLLQQSDAGRAVFLTSDIAEKCTAYWGLMAISKAALDAMVKTYAAENNTTNVTANLVSPCPISTAMRAKVMPGEDKDSLPKPMDLAKAMLPLFTGELEGNGKTYRFDGETLKA